MLVCTKCCAALQKLGHDGVFMIQIHSKISQEMRTLFQHLVNEYGRKQVIPVYPRTQHLSFLLEQRSENQHYEQVSAFGKRAWQSSLRITLNQDVARIGDGIEPLDALRENVEMRNDEDERPLDAEVPRARLNPKNRTNREKNKNMKIHVLVRTC